MTPGSPECIKKRLLKIDGWIDFSSRQMSDDKEVGRLVPLGLVEKDPEDTINTEESLDDDSK